jgi:hypothetical protein
MFQTFLMYFDQMITAFGQFRFWNQNDYRNRTEADELDTEI